MSIIVAPRRNRPGCKHSEHQYMSLLMMEDNFFKCRSLWPHDVFPFPSICSPAEGNKYHKKEKPEPDEYRKKGTPNQTIDGFQLMAWGLLCEVSVDEYMEKMKSKTSTHIKVSRHPKVIINTGADRHLLWVNTNTGLKTYILFFFHFNLKSAESLLIYHTRLKRGNGVWLLALGTI